MMIRRRRVNLGKTVYAEEYKAKGFVQSPVARNPRLVAVQYKKDVHLSECTWW